MINIFKRKEEYVFTTDKWFSSNFDSLTQLIDVGLDDTDKRELYSDEEERLDRMGLYKDLIYLCSVNTFEEIETKYPELFI